MTEENHDNHDDHIDRAQAHLASLKRDMRKTLEDAVVRAAHKVMAEFEAKSDERLMEPPPEFIDALKYDVARRDPEFFTHCVDQPYDWSEWVCPDPKSYLFKCCDCGLVHEAEFGVVRYKSDTDREDCDMVDDPNLQAVFRMRRSEQWSPADMAHRAGGLTMEQPAQQEPVAVVSGYYGGQCVILPIDPARIFNSNTALYTTPQPPAQPLTDEQIDKLPWGPHEGNPMTFAEGLRDFARAIEAAHGIKGDA